MIRPATTDDRGILREMFDEFYHSDAVLHPVPAAYHEAALDDLFSEGTGQSCFLLCRGEKACGYALLSKKYSHEAGGLELWLEELYLRPEARNQGLGSEFFDFLRRYDVTISLGDALRPGCIDDASDAGQISELIELGNLAQRA